MASSSPQQLTRDAYERVRKTRDARFDGLVYIAVTSTKIFCRPVCPAPSPKSKNVAYYTSAAAASAAGFRPCLRCRPELAPGASAWHASDELVRGALRLIEQGVLDAQPVSALARRVGVGERHLRRLFAEQLGASPIDVAAMRRVLFAKRLISDTDLPMTAVAQASGFASLRRFNAAFQETYRMPPRDVRRRRVAPESSEGHALRLPYREPFDAAGVFAFFAKRAVPGVEWANATEYHRHFVLYDAPGSLRVSAVPGDSALLLRVSHPKPQALLEVATRVRRMFDLDADVATIQSHLARDARLKPHVKRFPGLRVPGAWDPFELAVRAVLGQQVTVAAARTLASRIVARHGAALEDAPHPELHRAFPSAEMLADADLDGLGLTGSRIATLHTVARAWRDGVVDARPEQTLDEFVRRWTALPGIGTWTAHYLAMRALGHPDAFPAGDIVLRKALQPGTTLSEKALDAESQAWRPWRAYAVQWLWRSTG